MEAFTAAAKANETCDEISRTFWAFRVAEAYMKVTSRFGGSMDTFAICNKRWLHSYFAALKLAREIGPAIIAFMSPAICFEISSSTSPNTNFWNNSLPVMELVFNNVKVARSPSNCLVSNNGTILANAAGDMTKPRILAWILMNTAGSVNPDFSHAADNKLSHFGSIASAYTQTRPRMH